MFLRPYIRGTGGGGILTSGTTLYPFLPKSPPSNIQPILLTSKNDDFALDANYFAFDWHNPHFALPKWGFRSRNIFPNNLTFKNQKIGESFAKSDFLGIFFGKFGNFFREILGIFRPDSPKSRNYAVPFFKTRIFFQEI